MVFAREVRLEPFRPKVHSQQLREWLHKTYVAKWFGDPQEVLEKILRRAPGDSAVIEVGGIPIGYLCWQSLSQDEIETAGLKGLPEGIVDIDILIGVDEAVGRGIGPRALFLLMSRLQVDFQVSSVGVGASALNKSAIRAFEKAGFRLFQEFHDLKFGECKYMVLNLDDAF